ncbi:MAG TPA: deoxyribose-phosphate aldolase [Armatimonadetes bacterium]|nr:deoxyribose-phosphate aldolase [Armatimonadota bacterium]
MDFTYQDLAQMIDHALLKPELTAEEAEAGCRLAHEYGVKSVCVKPYFVRRAAAVLAESPVAVGTVIGFPHGGQATEVKRAEAERALADGAVELDVVVNIGEVRGGHWEYVEQDLATVVEAAHAAGGLVKVIFENAYLEEAHKIQLCGVCEQVGADFVKTSTGFAATGARIEDVRLMRAHCSARVGVKAAGGIRTLEQLLAFRAAGATRIGTSSTAAILAQVRARPPLTNPAEL